jgi:tRNA threonylcarbamoyladenosine biosynthesis protein TsaE
MELIFSLAEIGQAAKTFWEVTSGAAVFAFHGEMGAGKTTFIHALCDARGVEDVVGSPTFSIINEYLFRENEIVRKIFHIDLYRLRNEEEAMQAGVEDCLYSDHISLVEWPDRAPGIFPDNTVHVSISLADSGDRRLIIGRN